MLLHQVLNEVLRLTALVTFAVHYFDDNIVKGYCIPAGTPIVVALGVSLKKEAVWKHAEK